MTFSLAENNKEIINIAKKWLSSNFEMKDMDEVNYVLVVKIVRDRAKKVFGFISRHLHQNDIRALSHVI